MKGRRSKRLDIEIDKLTNSIENAISGEVAETLIVRLHGRDARSIKRREWRFDWRREIAEEHREVHKLVTATDPSVIQGLVSLEAKTDHVFLHLIENARFNVGSDKLYVGIAGNLFAFACKRSLEMGYDGFVSFVPKTVLREHDGDGDRPGGGAWIDRTLLQSEGPMGIVKEPREVDFLVAGRELTPDELASISAFIKKRKAQLKRLDRIRASRRKPVRRSPHRIKTT